MAETSVAIPIMKTLPVVLVSLVLASHSIGVAADQLGQEFGEVVGAEQLVRTDFADPKLLKLSALSKAISGKWGVTSTKPLEAGKAPKAIVIDFAQDNEKPGGTVTAKTEGKNIIDGLRYMISRSESESPAAPVGQFEKSVFIDIETKPGTPTTPTTPTTPGTPPKFETWRVLLLTDDAMTLLVPAGDGNAIRLSLSRVAQPVAPSLLFPAK